MAKLTAQRLREVLSYDPATGDLHWKKSLGKRTNIGDVAGALSTTKSARRIVIKVDGVMYLAHRLAWLYTYGTWPTLQIDHANGNGADNRLANLRLATNEENARNRRPTPSKSGLKGAAWDESRQQYIATIRTGGGERRTIGRYSTAEEAHEAYKTAAATAHKEFARYV